MMFAPAVVAAPQSLVIVTNIYPPYVTEDVENSFLPALLTEIGTGMGVTFELKILPWKRCEQSVNDLDAWGAIPYTSNAERAKIFLFSDPIYVADSHFFAYRHPREDNRGPQPESYDALSDLQQWRIGGIQGYYYQPLFEQAGLNIDFAHSENQNFQRLRLGRIDLVPAATTVGWHSIKELFPPEIVANFYTLPKPLVEDAALHLMTSKNYPDNQALLARFNAALNEVQKNGTFAQLVDQYGLVMRY
ncbi:MAG: transporter substrate-binding domain-containing protein [Rhodospirillales bacterium]|nr:transporter substrate-binding domain-containing protein [Rhodospirillales bacterium]